MKGFLLHETKPAERWDHIAYAHYGDASLYEPIIDANRDLFPALAQLPPVLPAKLILRVPVLDTTPRLNPEDLPPWKR